MKVWLLCAVVLASAVLALKHLSNVIGSGCGGSGLKVAQYVVLSANEGTANITGMLSPASEEVGSLDVELDASMRYIIVLFVSDALRTYVSFILVA